MSAEPDIAAPVGSGDFSIGGALWPGLSKVIEESGEVGELLPEIILMKALHQFGVTSGKLIGSEGDTNHWSGDLKVRMIEEIGDLIAAIEFYVRTNDLPIGLDGGIRSRADTKFALFNQWHAERMSARPS